MRLLWLISLLVLAGCAPRVDVSEQQRGEWGLQRVVTAFAPDRNEGGKYKVGERVFFSFTLSQTGYVTLVTIDPDTTTAVLERNVRLEAGRHTFPRKTDVTAQGQATYRVFPPTGTSRFRLIFSDVPGTTSSTFEGKLGVDDLNRQTQAFIAQAKVRDVIETTMETIQ